MMWPFFRYNNFEATLQTLYTYINAPAFNQDALDKAKAEVVAHLITRDKYFPEAINENSLNQLSLSDVKAYYLEISNPGQTILTIAGNITVSYTTISLQFNKVVFTSLTLAFLAVYF